MMIKINEQIYRKHLAKYAYEHGWTSEQIAEAFNWAKKAWERLSREKLDDNLSETSTDKFVNYIECAINDIAKDSEMRAELVRGMLVAFIYTLREQREERNA